MNVDKAFENLVYIRRERKFGDRRTYSEARLTNTENEYLFCGFALILFWSFKLVSIVNEYKV
jgi:hypothetical protein